MKNRFHSPDYRKTKIGYTRIPTAIAENPKAWGLEKNELTIYVFLASRIKKTQHFNGESLKRWLKGSMGMTAISNALQRLCELGFCTKVVHRADRNQFAGWDYNFFAIPKCHDKVFSIDPELCEKLDEAGWFSPSPEYGIPDYGVPSGKESKEKKKRNEKEKTPLPLSTKEADNIFSFPGKEYPVADTGGPGDYTSPGSDGNQMGNSSGKHRSRLLKNPVGRRILETLRPEQIPTDYALRPLARLVDQGRISAAYWTFLEEKLIKPNQLKFDQGSRPLKTIEQIVSIYKNKELSPTSAGFRNWQESKIAKLRREWNRLHSTYGGYDDFLRELSEGVLESGCWYIDDPGSTPRESPFGYAVYLNRAQLDASLYKMERVSLALVDDEIWVHLLDEAVLNYREFFSLHYVIETLQGQIPDSRRIDLASLHENWGPRRTARASDLERRFEDMGIRVPVAGSNHGSNDRPENNVEN